MMKVKQHSSLTLALVVLARLLSSSWAFVVVYVPREDLDVTETIAIQACVGLYNGRSGGSAYAVHARKSDMSEHKDLIWLELLKDAIGVPTEEFEDPYRFLQHRCFVDFPCVTYSLFFQQKLMPNILTLGAVKEAIPVDPARMALECNNVAADALTEFRGLDTPFMATQYMYNNYVKETTGLAMLQPGYDQDDMCYSNPALTRAPEVSMVDFVFSRKLFTIFMVNACIPLTKENYLMTRISQENPWGQDPIPVYGYASYWLIEGYLFEAQTNCVALGNMGAVPTLTDNLSFFSTRRQPITLANNTLQQNAPEDIVYDPQKTYVAFVVGDGDNTAFVLDKRREWILEYLQACQEGRGGCKPLTFSLSPHLPTLAPDVIEWYYKVANLAENLYFMLPPSGHLYAYPTLANDNSQANFVALTEADAKLMGTKSTCHWDFFGTWQGAIHKTLPRYAKEGVINGIFPLATPYLLPIFTLWNGNRYKVLSSGEDGKVVLFRPRSWRGVDEGSSDFLGTIEKALSDAYLSSEEMAAELSSFPRGTVAYVYMTSDGGLNLTNSFLDLAGRLPDHVELVSADTLTRMALAADEASAGFTLRGTLCNLFLGLLC